MIRLVARQIAALLLAAVQSVLTAQPTAAAAAA
jgi:hypothetical protein